MPDDEKPVDPAHSGATPPGANGLAQDGDTLVRIPAGAAYVLFVFPKPDTAVPEMAMSNCLNNIQIAGLATFLDERARDMTRRMLNTDKQREAQQRRILTAVGPVAH